MGIETRLARAWLAILASVALTVVIWIIGYLAR